jgi:hypothetical protein
VKLIATGRFTYYNIYFKASAYMGEPVVAEPDKCDAIGWFDMEDLPPDIISERTQAIRDHFAGVHYHEAGIKTRPRKGLVSWWFSKGKG